jgi:predicted transcriptional regulator
MEAQMAEATTTANLLPLASDIVTAHLSNNKVPSSDLPDLIRNVVHALAAVSAGGPAPTPRPDAAVPVKKSVTPDYIVCLEDGRKLKMLKRHLRTSYQMSPDQYRARWNLPSDYPMVAPNYAKKRSKLAKAIGLGTKPRRKRD